MRIHDRCEELVATAVATATAEEIADVREAAYRLIARAQAIAEAMGAQIDATVTQE